jgi:hypothetical protein
MSVEGSPSIILRIAQVQAQICLRAGKDDIECLAMLIRFDNLNYMGIMELFNQLQVRFLDVESQSRGSPKFLSCKFSNISMMLLTPICQLHN